MILEEFNKNDFFYIIYNRKNNFKNMKNLIKLDSFSGLKKGEKINESVRLLGDKYEIMKGFSIPKSLVASYIKKVKDDSGQDIKSFYGDEIIAEKIFDYVMNTLVNIDNLPVTIVLGDTYKGVQVQPSTQSQPAPQGQTEVQEQTPESQTAAQIPAEEGGNQGQDVQGQATQGQATQGQAPAVQAPQGQSI